MAGESWGCPYCREVILRSAVTCPACQRHLHVRAVGSGRAARVPVCPLSVDGKIRHPGSGTDWEYSVLVEIHDEHDNIVSRRVVGVGALRPGESRKFTLRVEVLTPEVSALAGH